MNYCIWQKDAIRQCKRSIQAMIGVAHQILMGKPFLAIHLSHELTKVTRNKYYSENLIEANWKCQTFQKKNIKANI